MNLPSNIKRYIITTLILSLLLLLFACSSPTQTSTPPVEPAAPSETAPISDNSSTLTVINVQPDRVDVVYFHRPQRCPSCLCFEERVRYVVSTYFQNEIDTGNMTFGVYDIGDSQNIDIVKKYGAVSSQLFINTVRDGTDNIKDIQDIWSWSCRTDKAGFDQKVKDVIEQSLKSVE